MPGDCAIPGAGVLTGPTGVLWLADVGQNAWEEVNLIERGGNYGWDCREGTHDFETSRPVAAGPSTSPISEYSHTAGQPARSPAGLSTGVAQFRVCKVDMFSATFESGRIWALQSDGMGGYTNEELDQRRRWPVLVRHRRRMASLYYTDINSGRIMQLVPDGGGADRCRTCCQLRVVSTRATSACRIADLFPTTSMRHSGRMVPERIATSACTEWHDNCRSR